jgi:hypothetical protein
MPNWCSNSLSLTHSDPERIRAAVTAFESGKFLEHFVPLPNAAWDYDFCVSKWGTKWDVSGQVIDVTDHHAEFSFDSAWTPPLEAYKIMAAQGFEVLALYHEPGMAFVGKITGHDLDFNDEYHEYASETSDTVRLLIGEELDDHWGISEYLADNEADDLEETEDTVNELEFDDLDRISGLGPHTD